MVLDVKSLERLKKAVVFEEPLNKVDQSVLDIFEVQKGPKLLPPWRLFILLMKKIPALFLSLSLSTY